MVKRPHVRYMQKEDFDLYPLDIMLAYGCLHSNNIRGRVLVCIVLA